MNTPSHLLTVLITGGTGFVMSNLALALLERYPEACIVILDRAPVEGMVTELLGPHRDRVYGVQGDVRDRAVLEHVSAQHPVSHVVHAATVTHFPPWERERPDGYIDINVMGTVNVLEWARRLDGLKKFLYVSSGGVYGEPAPDSPAGPQPETGPCHPPELYAVSKLAAEQIVRRYGELFDLDTLSVRLSGVFGPMERPTAGRVAMAVPYHMMRSVIERRPFRVTAGTLEAGGDFLSAEDVADALTRVLGSGRTAHDVYNIAFGVFTSIAGLVAACRRAVPGFDCEVVEAARADVVMDPDRRLARWNAYAIDRAVSDFGWRPRPLAEQLAAYYEWVDADPERRCPPLAERPAEWTL